MLQFEVVSFDLWNTLCYTKRPDTWRIEPEIRKIWRTIPHTPQGITVETFITAYKARMANQPPAGVKTDYTEQRSDQIITNLLKDLGEAETPQLESFVQKLITKYFKRQLKWTYIYPEVHTILKTLKEKKIKLILISDHQWPPDGHAILEKYALTNYFDQIVFSGEIGYHKPSPEIFERGIKGINLSKRSKLLHVGDDYYRDVQGVIGVGGKAIWIDSWTNADYQRMQYTRPEKTQRHPAELIGRIEHIGEFSQL